MTLLEYRSSLKNSLMSIKAYYMYTYHTEKAKPVKVGVRTTQTKLHTAEKSQPRTSDDFEPHATCSLDSYTPRESHISGIVFHVH